MMDIVMDLKEPAGVWEESQEYREDNSNVFMLTGDRSSGKEDASCLHPTNNKCNYDYADSYNHFVLTDDEGLAAYWAEQAAIWMDGGTSAFSDDDDDDSDNNTNTNCVLTRFPVSMERSTATWEYP